MRARQVGERGERGGGRKRDKKDAIYLTPVTYWGGGGGGEKFRNHQDGEQILKLDYIGFKGFMNRRL